MQREAFLRKLLLVIEYEYDNLVETDVISGELNATEYWQQSVINITNYGVGVRYLLWEDGGKSNEKW